jgi:Holliday junction resolvase RusA-like endonuclease
MKSYDNETTPMTNGKAKTTIIKIYAEPVPKGRPRFSRHGIYTPPKTKIYEERVAWDSKRCWNKQPLKDIPIEIKLWFFFKRPKKITSKTVGKCDLDNLTKSTLDGMQKIVFEDDRQITRLSAVKDYAFKGDKPYVEVEIIF